MYLQEKQDRRDMKLDSHYSPTSTETIKRSTTDSPLAMVHLHTKDSLRKNQKNRWKQKMKKKARKSRKTNPSHSRNVTSKTLIQQLLHSGPLKETET